MTTTPLRDACTTLGGVSATARALGISRRLLQGWLAAGYVPKTKQLLQLSQLTGISPWDLGGESRQPHKSNDAV